MEDREWETYQRFRQNAAAFLAHTTLSEWDWMLYMRHYEVPTRLLDWTESPLIALYFAVEDEDSENDGVVWCLSPEKLNERAGHEPPRILCAGVDSELNEYTPTSVRQAPETSAFAPVALIAARAFPRLVAQQGVFTIIHREATALEHIDNGMGLLQKIRIDKGAKKSILKDLARLGIHRLTLFPEIQSVVTRLSHHA